MTDEPTERLLSALEDQMDAMEELHQALLAWDAFLIKQLEVLDEQRS